MSTCVELGNPHCDCCWDEGFDCCACGELNPYPTLPIEDYLTEVEDSIFDDDDTLSLDDVGIDWDDDSDDDDFDDE